jgi:pyruvate/2-oxoacid:ferredoxin oxidoreductase beta subunit
MTTIDKLTQINENENKSPSIIIIYSSYTEAQKRATLKWQLKNKDKIKLYREKYKEKNNDKIKLVTKQWIEKNHDYMMLKWKQAYEYKKSCDVDKEFKRLCSISVF